MPIQVGYTTDFSIIQYVDNESLIMEAYPQQLYALKTNLHTFAESSGLKVNYVKSSMFPININNEILNHLAASFNCQPGAFPFTYLGLPLSLLKPTAEDCLPLASTNERRLVNTSNLPTQGGKLQLVNSVFSSLPTFYMCSMTLPAEIKKQIDKYCRHCLWRGDIDAKKPPLTAWNLVTRSKLKGGLGVIKLGLHNEVLLMKNLHNFFSKQDLPLGETYMGQIL
jgi:hypothetical protein